MTDYLEIIAKDEISLQQSLSSWVSEVEWIKNVSIRGSDYNKGELLVNNRSGMAYLIGKHKIEFSVLLSELESFAEINIVTLRRDEIFRIPYNHR